MKMKLELVLAIIMAAISSIALADDSNPDNGKKSEEKLTIKVVMQKVMKSGMCKKVALGKASQEETKKAHQLFKAMAKMPAPKGKASSWKKLTTELVVATELVMNGKPSGTKRLKKAANCSACHKEHRPRVSGL